MPEGPEILSYVLLFREEFMNKKLENIISYGTSKKINLPDNKNVITNIDCKGKLLWFELDNENYLQIHLKITGHYLFEEPDNYLRYKFIFTKNGDEYNLFIEDKRGFVSIKILNKEEHNKEIKKIGVSIFDNKFSFEYFEKLIKKKKNVLLCRFLFDQSNISGIGNYILNEIMYLSNIEAGIKISELSDEEIEDLYKNILFVGYSNLLTYLKRENIQIKKEDYKNMPLKKNLEIPYELKIYGQTKTSDGKKVKNKKVCNRKMYYV